MTNKALIGLVLLTVVVASCGGSSEPAAPAPNAPDAPNAPSAPEQAAPAAPTITPPPPPAPAPDQPSKPAAAAPGATVPRDSTEGTPTASRGVADKPVAPKPSPAPAFTRRDLQVGTGREAQKGKGLSVHYTGWLYDPSSPELKGRMFDTSKGRGPFEFVLGGGQVIPGWDQGFDGMKIGGRRRLIIPPHLAYGVDGAGNGIIPPNATLIFEMELLDVQQ